MRRDRARREFVLVDPLAPADEADSEEFWRAVDRDVEHHGAPHVVLTAPWHRRSTDEVWARYDGTRVWAYRGETEGGTATDRYDLDTELPGGLRAFDAHWAPEAVLWSAEHAALLTGDVILGASDGVRLLPDAVAVRGHHARRRRRGAYAAPRPARRARPACARRAGDRGRRRGSPARAPGLHAAPARPPRGGRARRAGRAARAHAGTARPGPPARRRARRAGLRPAVILTSPLIARAADRTGARAVLGSRPSRSTSGSPQAPRPTASRGGRAARRDGRRGRPPAGRRLDRDACWAAAGARRTSRRPASPPWSSDVNAVEVERAAQVVRRGRRPSAASASTIAAGEVFGLLGPNGAGKTTTVEILEGYRERDGGDGHGARRTTRRARPASWREPHRHRARRAAASTRT